MKWVADNYDNPSWHQQMCKQKHLFSFLKDGEIVGGVLLWVSKENVYIGRIFIDPKFFRKGYGIKLMKAIELLYPRKEYVLDTPCWNIRTKNFYIKSGYKIVEEKKKIFKAENEIQKKIVETSILFSQFLRGN